MPLPYHVIGAYPFAQTHHCACEEGRQLHVKSQARKQLQSTVTTRRVQIFVCRGCIQIGPSPAHLNLNQYRSYKIYQAHIHNHHNQVAVLDTAQILKATQNIITQNQQTQLEQTEVQDKVKQLPSEHERANIQLYLLQAAETGDLPLLQRLFTLDTVDVNAPDDEGYTPLHHAIENKHLLIAKALIEQGADVNLYAQRPLRTSEPPIHLALEHTSQLANKFIDLLLDAGAPPRS